VKTSTRAADAAVSAGRHSIAAAQPLEPPALRPGEPEAIFVVGVSRSGTTLLRRILQRSPRIGIAQENHYLGHLLPRQGVRHHFRRLGDLGDDATIRRIVDSLYGGGFRRRSRLREISPFWRWLLREVPRADVEQRLLAAERTERGVWVALLRLYAERRGNKPIIGEKTPAHLRYADTLLEWFTDGRVVHIMRDPRAIYVSDTRRRRERPTAPYSWLMRVPLAFETVMLLQTGLTWALAARHHFRLAARQPERYLMVRFEDVVGDPAATLPRLFAALGVEMPAGVDEVRVVSRGFRHGEQGLDAAAAQRWREQIHPLARRLLGLLLGHHLRRLGYTG
jgi:hypothetical protein